MAEKTNSGRLKKDLTLFKIYAIATGATLSSGLFLLPGLAMEKAGPAMIIAYILAIIPLLPGIISKVELATAMPRSGGVYYFLDRSLGPLFGTVGGLGVWLVMILKTVFALVGIGAYLGQYFPAQYETLVVCGFALLFGSINLMGAKKSGLLQTILVSLVLLILIWFSIMGFPRVQNANFANFFGKMEGNPYAILETAGLLCVSYIGVTKVASVAEEIKNPERNLPLGVFLAMATALLVYAIGSYIMVGVVSPLKLAKSLTPAADTALILGGDAGRMVITIGAIFAFSSVANAGILSASRYPLALSRDQILPGALSKLSKGGIPRRAILLTLFLILVCLLSLNALKIAKLASAFQLLTFSLVCVAVIVMRESRIESYDPGYRSPFYPVLHIVGTILPFWFIYLMGALPMLFGIGVIVLGSCWYYYYARKRISRGGAIYHIFARLGEKRYEGLDRELRGILKEKGLRAEDPFDDLIARSDIHEPPPDKMDFESIVKEVSKILATRLDLSSAELTEKYLQGTRVGATPVSKGMALPHIRLDIEKPELIMVRIRSGVLIELLQEFWGAEAAQEEVHAMFFLVGPEKSPKQHLRILAQIAECVDRDAFMEDWLSAETEQDMKEIILQDERFLSLHVGEAGPTEDLIGKALREIRWPPNTLVAMIHREGQLVIPDGKTVLTDGDLLTILGEPREMKVVKKLYGPGRLKNKVVTE